jgi:hypothetical protein
MRSECQLANGGAAPATLGFNAVAPEWLSCGAADAAPAVPAAESTLGSHPYVALSSAQVLPEWINRNLADNVLAANGDYPLNFVSHSRGSLQLSVIPNLVSRGGPDYCCRFRERGRRDLETIPWRRDKISDISRPARRR